MERGLFSLLVQNSVSKVQKTGYFAYSAWQWGWGAIDRTSHLATLLGIADSHEHRNLSMHGKCLLIKTLLLPHITLTAREFWCPRKAQMLISKILHKFLCSPSYFEPVSRITLCKINAIVFGLEQYCFLDIILISHSQPNYQRLVDVVCAL